jgi:hypothetical protein
MKRREVLRVFSAACGDGAGRPTGVARPAADRRRLGGPTGTRYWGTRPAMFLRDRCRRPIPGCRRPIPGCRRRWRRARASTSGEAASCRRLCRCMRGPTRSWSGARRCSGFRWATEKKRFPWTASSRTRGRSQCSRWRHRSEVGRQDRPPHPPLPPADDSAEGGPVETA